jgi:hypothetical protein
MKVKRFVGGVLMVGPLIGLTYVLDGWTAVIATISFIVCLTGLFVGANLIMDTF